jgi:hypothetical protein
MPQPYGHLIEVEQADTHKDAHAEVLSTPGDADLAPGIKAIGLGQHLHDGITTGAGHGAIIDMGILNDTGRLAATNALSMTLGIDSSKLPPMLTAATRIPLSLKSLLSADSSSLLDNAI